MVLLGAAGVVLQLQVGLCIRSINYRGLSAQYGAPLKIVEIGESALVVQEWLGHRKEWDDPVTKLNIEMPNFLESITCPVPAQKASPTTKHCSSSDNNKPHD